MKVGRDPQWQIERADDILDHLVSALNGQGTIATVEPVQVVIIQPVERLYGLQPLERFELIEPAKL
jgi:hypothetical protein